MRPHLTALTIEAKLSSVRMMSHASLATSVPAIPYEGEEEKERKREGGRERGCVSIVCVNVHNNIKGGNSSTKSLES